MERPVKRLKIASLDPRSPRQTRMKMSEGLFTSDVAIPYEEEDGNGVPTPTRTIALSDLRRRYWPAPKLERRQLLPRGNQGIQLRPRAPDATVTANVVDINVSDGTSTVSAAEVTLTSGPVTVALSSYTLTVPALSTTTDASNGTETSSQSSGISATSSDTISTTIDTASSSISLNAAASVFSAALANSTTTNSITNTSSERTFTVTATSTYELSYINGTYIAPATATAQSTLSIDTSGSSSGSSSHPESASGSPLSSSSGSHTAITTTSHASSAKTSGADSTSSSNAPLIPLASSYFSQSTETASASPTLSPPSSTSSNASSATHSSGGGGVGLTPVQQQVVGGVVGGVAGLAVVLLALLIFLRWYRRRLKSQGRLPEQIDAQRSRDLTSAGTGAGMSQRSSGVPLAATMASNFKRWARPQSAQTFVTTATGSTVPESDRGFQRVAGRKIAPVLGTGGGDQYGGNYGAFEKETATPTPTDSKNIQRGLAGGSFYKDSAGFYHGRSNSNSALWPSVGPDRPSSPYQHQRGPSATRDFAKAFPVRAGDPSDRFASHSDLSLPLPNIHAATTVSRDASRERPVPRQIPRPGMDRAAGSGLGVVRAAEGYAAMRPSPARTPTLQSPNVSNVRLSMPPGNQVEAGSMWIETPSDAPPTPELPTPGGGGGFNWERGRLGVPTVGERGVSQGSSTYSRGSGSRFREALS